MSRFIVATVVASVLLFAGPAVANADRPSERPVLGTALSHPTPPPFAGRETVGVPAVLAVVAVRVILKKVARKGTRLKRGIKRVARPRVRPKLTPKTLNKLVSEARSWSKLGGQAAQVSWGQLSPAVQGCVVGIAHSRVANFPAGPDLVPKIDYYNEVNAAVFPYWKPFGTSDPNLVPQPVKLAREFSNEALSTLGVCALGAAYNSKFELPRGL